MKHFDDRVAAITGAASGIGRSLASELARRGAHLALSDVDEAGLEQTAEAARRHGTKVTTRRVDVADRDAVHEWADQVAAEHGRVNLIANNAGVALGSTVEQMAYDDAEWLLGINLWGVVHGTKAFLPHLRAAGEGHVVNVSSVFGLLGIPSQSAYNAAKFAVRGFTESLRIELDVARCGVSATCVHPGGIKTNIARNARINESVSDLGADPASARRDFERLLVTSPDAAARAIVRAVQLDKRRALIGPDAYALDLLAHLPVGVGQRLIAVGARRAR